MPGAIMLNKNPLKQTLVMILLTAWPALADPPHSRAGLVEVFRDWRLDCREGPCTIGTAVVAADGTELLRLAVSAGGPPALAVTTPLPLHLPDGLALALGELPERQDAWRTCGTGGCEATLTLEGELLDGLRREREGTATFTLVGGERVRLGFSLLGFSAALQALDARPVR
jgi:invasion protein IalB